MFLIFLVEKLYDFLAWHLYTFSLLLYMVMSCSHTKAYSFNSEARGSQFCTGFCILFSTNISGTNIDLLVLVYKEYIHNQYQLYK